MAPSVSLGLCVLLVLAHGCLGYSGFQPFQSQGLWSGSIWQGQQRHRPLRSQNECNLDNINVAEPINRIKAEGGTIEYFSNNDQQFQCAGINAVRHVIEPQGLLLPSFSNAPQISYIIQGRGVLGAVFTGCEESYQSGTSQGSSRWSRRGESQRGQGQGQTGRSNDQHQKIRNFRQGDIIALPAGVSHWIYNDGQTPIVAITIFDTSNDANQLDQSIRKFFLAGSSQSQQGRGQRGRQEGPRGPWKGRGEQSENWQSIFSGLDEELLSDVFNVNQEVIRSLRGQKEQRGSIILVREPLEFLTPEREEQEYSRGRSQHGGKWMDDANKRAAGAEIRSELTQRAVHHKRQQQDPDGERAGPEGVRRTSAGGAAPDRAPELCHPKAGRRRRS
uniref:Cupin type-1 domain-containing protein n=1 Tax=Kalanchoe fedtschenkoi TaxID=63787 RepID=A0A7N1A829_KALFE